MSSVVIWHAAAAIALIATFLTGAERRRRGRRSRRPTPRLSTHRLVGAALTVLALGEALALSGAGPASLSPGSFVIATLGMVLLAVGLLGAVADRYPGRDLDALATSALAATAAASGAEAWGQPIAVTVAFGVASFGPALAGTLLFTTSERLPAQWLAFAGTAALAASYVIGVAADSAGAELGPGVFAAMTLAGCALWAAAGVHPSTAHGFDPVAPKPVGLGRGRTVFLVACAVAGAVAASVAAALGRLPAGLPLTVLTTMAATLALLYVTRMVRARERLEWHGSHDELTGLPSRVVFEERLSLAIAHARRSQVPLAVMFVDLDRFKVVNDKLGHAEGNRLLKEAARRLRRAVRETDTVSRFGGDEFAVLCPQVASADEAATLAARLLEVFQRKFKLERGESPVTASIGVALFPADGNDGDTLLRHADAAMYRAKELGRNAFQVFSQEITHATQERLALESGLQDAIARRELELHYQPKVHVESGRVVGVEALLRWRHPQRGLLGPDHFVNIAEEFGHIDQLGHWVLMEACRQVRALQEAGFPKLSVSVNVSPKQFKERPLASVVEGVLLATGFDARFLELELTEGLAMDTGEETVADLYAIGRLGVQCSIDDFGTGYSSLSYLTRLPIKLLKIDKSFVMRIGPSKEGDDAAVVRAVIAMAHSLGLQVVAEGLETTHQLEFLRRHGCDYAQGYLISAPLPAAELETFLILHQAAPGPRATVGSTEN